MNPKAIVCVTNDLATDQRVRKTCITLQSCGYDVLETGRLLPNSLSFHPPYSIRRKRHWFNKGALFYAEYNIRLFFFLLFAKVDLIYSNDLDTLLACYLVARFRHKKLIYDTHEYFTEVPELVKRPKVQGIWEGIEKRIFPKLEKVITVNQSIAELYEKKYGQKVAVVRNIPKYESITQHTLSYDKIIIYQGALNKGRTLELAIDMMSFLTDYQLHIYGKGDVEDELKKQVDRKKLSDRVCFFGVFDPKTLKEKTQSATFGWCLMENVGLNYYYSLPNRIFDYLHAGIPVISNDYPEMETVVRKYNIGIIVEKLEAKYIAEKIKTSETEIWNKKYFDTVSQELCWQNEQKNLIEVIQK